MSVFGLCLLMYRTYFTTFSMSWKAKCHEANPIYGLLYVFLTNFYQKITYYEANSCLDRSSRDMWSRFDLQMSCKVKYIWANHHSQICTYIVTCFLGAYPIISVHPLFWTMVMLIHYKLMSGCMCMHVPMVYKHFQ